MNLASIAITLCTIIVILLIIDQFVDFGQFRKKTKDTFKTKEELGRVHTGEVKKAMNLETLSKTRNLEISKKVGSKPKPSQATKAATIAAIDMSSNLRREESEDSDS